MLFRDGGVVGDCVGLTSPRRSCKDGSVVFGVCVVLTQAEKKKKGSAYYRQRNKKNKKCWNLIAK